MGLATHRRGGNGAEGQTRYYGINAVRVPEKQRSACKVSACKVKARALCGQGPERAREGSTRPRVMGYPGAISRGRLQKF